MRSSRKDQVFKTLAVFPAKDGPMERWRVLFITPYVPSPIRVRSYNLSQALVARGHRVHVLALASSAEEAGEAERLRARGVDVTTVPLPRRQSLANCARAVFTGRPLQAAFTWSPAMWRTVAQVLAAEHHTIVPVSYTHLTLPTIYSV